MCTYTYTRTYPEAVTSFITIKTQEGGEHRNTVYGRRAHPSGRRLPYGRGDPKRRKKNAMAAGQSLRAGSSVREDIPERRGCAEPELLSC
eukprot:6403283-Pyramimonas_sp.AAC.1